MGASCGEIESALGLFKYPLYLLIPPTAVMDLAAGVILPPFGALGDYIFDKIDEKHVYDDIKYKPWGELTEAEQDPTLKKYVAKISARKEEITIQIEKEKADIKLKEKEASQSGDKSQIAKLKVDYDNLEQDYASLGKSYTWFIETVGKYNQLATKELMPILKDIERDRILAKELGFDRGLVMQYGNAEDTINTRASSLIASKFRDAFYDIQNPRTVYRRDNFFFFREDRCNTALIPARKNSHPLFYFHDDFPPFAIADEIVNNARAEVEKGMKENPEKRAEELTQQQIDIKAKALEKAREYGHKPEGFIGMITTILDNLEDNSAKKKNPAVKEYLAEIEARKNSFAKELLKTSDSDGIARLEYAYQSAYVAVLEIEELVNKDEPLMKLMAKKIVDLGIPEAANDKNGYVDPAYKDLNKLVDEFQSKVDRVLEKAYNSIIKNSSARYEEEFKKILPETKISKILMKNILNELKPAEKKLSMNDSKISDSLVAVTLNDISSQQLPTKPQNLIGDFAISRFAV